MWKTLHNAIPITHLTACSNVPTNSLIYSLIPTFPTTLILVHGYSVPLLVMPLFFSFPTVHLLVNLVGFVSKHPSGLQVCFHCSLHDPSQSPIWNHTWVSVRSSVFLLLIHSLFSTWFPLTATRLAFLTPRSGSHFSTQYSLKCPSHLTYLPLLYCAKYFSILCLDIYLFVS